MENARHVGHWELGVVFSPMAKTSKKTYFLNLFFLGFIMTGSKGKYSCFVS